MDGKLKWIQSKVLLSAEIEMLVLTRSIYLLNAASVPFRDLTVLLICEL